MMLWEGQTQQKIIFQRLIEQSPPEAWFLVDLVIISDLIPIAVELGFSMTHVEFLLVNSYLFEHDIIVWTEISENSVTLLATEVDNFSVENTRCFLLNFNPFLLYEEDQNGNLDLYPLFQFSFLTGDLQDFFETFDPATAFKALFRSNCLDILRYLYPLDVVDTNLQVNCCDDMHFLMEGIRRGGVEALRQLLQKVCILESESWLDLRVNATIMSSLSLCCLKK